MLIYLVGFGIAIYNLLFPGKENWGLLTAYVIGGFSGVVLIIDIFMKCIFSEKKINIGIQMILLVIFLIVVILN